MENKLVVAAGVGGAKVGGVGVAIKGQHKGWKCSVS